MVISEQRGERQAGRQTERERERDRQREREREREGERERERERETDTIGFYAPHQLWDNMNQNKTLSKQVQSISKRINIKCKKNKHAYANIKRKCSEFSIALQ